MERMIKQIADRTKKRTGMPYRVEVRITEALPYDLVGQIERTIP